jgi:hypothetical protein
MHKKQLYHTASEKVSEREREREKPSKSIKRIRFFEKSTQNRRSHAYIVADRASNVIHIGAYLQ